LAIGGIIVFIINSTDTTAPTTTEATLDSCCLCSWELESEDGDFATKYNTEGILHTTNCELFDGLSPNPDSNECTNFDEDYGEWTTNMSDLGSCIENNTIGVIADPSMPPEDGGEVDIMGGFTSFESDTTHSGYEQFKIEIIYPEEDSSPLPITIDVNDNNEITGAVTIGESDSSETLNDTNNDSNTSDEAADTENSNNESISDSLSDMSDNNNPNTNTTDNNNSESTTTESTASDTSSEDLISRLDLTTSNITLPGDQQAALYMLKYSTTWDDIIKPSMNGPYKVRFSARYRGEDSWTDPTNPESFLEFIPSGESTRQSFCNDLDISAQGNITPLDVTLNVDASITESIDPIYQWNLDLNCDGQIDPQTSGEQAEQFVTSGTGLEQKQVTRTFNLPPDTEEADCQASVKVFLNDKALQDDNPLPARTDSACNRTVSLKQASPDCGNGTCDPNETCDLNGNIDCVNTPQGNPLPSGQTCREDCSYCGDGMINANEDCDPNIPQGQPGYNANCNSDCSIEDETSDQDQDEQDPDPDPQDPEQQSILDVITSVDKDCVELVSPNNIINVTIAVTNPQDTTTPLNAISDTLPRGFSYTPNSTQINNTAVEDTNEVVIESTGESQLITWNNAGNGWIIPAGGMINITFQATAGENTQMGEKTNEITVTPGNANPIPASSTFTTAQNCSQPDTGLFDNNIVVILMGTSLLLIAGAAYYTGFGSQKMALLMDTIGANITKTKNDLILILTKPQKYKEKKIEKSALKNINQHIDDPKQEQKNKN
jgi:hypothetical protein